MLLPFKSINFFELLYRIRISSAALSLLFILYCVVFVLFFVPYGGPLTRWNPNASLVVLEVDTNSPLAVGDIVESIGGQRPNRTRPTYPLPLQESYEFNILRNGELLKYDISVDAKFNMDIAGHYFPAIILALIGWLSGVSILFLADSQNRQAIVTGCLFMASAVVLMSIQAALDGAPGHGLVAMCSSILWHMVGDVMVFSRMTHQ